MLVGLFELSKRLGLSDTAAVGFTGLGLLAGDILTFPFAVRVLWEETGGFDGYPLAAGSTGTGFLPGRFRAVRGGVLVGKEPGAGEAGLGNALVAVDGKGFTDPAVGSAFGALDVATGVALTAVFFCGPPLTGPSAAIEFCTCWPYPLI